MNNKPSLKKRKQYDSITLFLRFVKEFILVTGGVDFDQYFTTFYMDSFLIDVCKLLFRKCLLKMCSLN